MRYLLLAMFVVLFGGSLSLGQNDYMQQTNTPSILQKLELERTDNGYNTFGTFMLVDGKEVRLPVTSEFYETIKIGTKVIVPIRGLDIEPSISQLVIKGFIPAMLMVVSLVLSIMYFALSIAKLSQDIKSYRRNKKKFQK